MDISSRRYWLRGWLYEFGAAEQCGSASAHSNDLQHLIRTGLDVIRSCIVPLRRFSGRYGSSPVT